MALTDIDRGRPQPLAPETIDALVKVWNVFGSQYTLLADAPTISDPTILSWLSSAQAIDRIHENMFRQDTIGTYQGLTGIWQILCRQGSIAPGKADETLAALVTPFNAIRNPRDLFDAGRNGLNVMMKATGATGGTFQERMLGLLAGGSKLDDSEARAELVQQEQRIFEAQKLLAADLIFELADNLEGVTKGEKLNAQLRPVLLPEWQTFSCPATR